jgi:hypothetical protein
MLPVVLTIGFGVADAVLVVVRIQKHYSAILSKRLK